MPSTPTTSALPAPALTRTVRGTGPGLVLVHGAGGSAAGNWGPVQDKLAERFTVIAADLPGSGDTPRAGAPLDLDALADQQAAAAQAEGHERFALAGYSLGAAIAVRTAVRHPERVTGLVLVAGVARADRRLRLITGLWGELVAQPRVLAQWGMIAGYREQDLERVLEPGFDPVVTAHEAQQPGLADQVELVGRTDVIADLPGVRVPTLVVSTAADTFIPPSQHRALHAGIPGARLVEIDSGHLLQAEHMDELAVLMGEFFS